MSVSIQSPLGSDVFQSLDYSLSPPPTPIAKRGLRFFPEGAERPLVPAFLPVSRSVMGPPGPSALVGEEATRERMARLSSRPAPRRRLALRTANRDGQRREAEIEARIRAGLAPPPPFAFPGPPRQSPTSNEGSESPPPLFSSREDSPRSVEPPSRSDPSCPKKMQGAAKADRKPAKLPSFRRGGVRRQTERRMNSLAAKSA